MVEVALCCPLVLHASITVITLPSFQILPAFPYHHFHSLEAGQIHVHRPKVAGRVREQENSAFFAAPFFAGGICQVSNSFPEEGSECSLVKQRRVAGGAGEGLKNRGNFPHPKEKAVRSPVSHPLILRPPLADILYF